MPANVFHDVQLVCLHNGTEKNMMAGLHSRLMSGHQYKGEKLSRLDRPRDQLETGQVAGHHDFKAVCLHIPSLNTVTAPHEPFHVSRSTHIIKEPIGNMLKNKTSVGNIMEVSSWEGDIV